MFCKPTLALVTRRVFNVVGENHQKTSLLAIAREALPGLQASIVQRKPDLRDYRVSGDRIRQDARISSLADGGRCVSRSGGGGQGRILPRSRLGRSFGCSHRRFSRAINLDTASAGATRLPRGGSVRPDDFRRSFSRRLRQGGSDACRGTYRRGYRVTGVDVVESQVKALNDGSFRTNEPGVMERLARLKPGQFLATMDPAEAVHRSSVSFIIVPTPSNTLGGFSNRLIIDALKAIGKAAAQKSGSHVVSVVSTVLPKSSSAQLIPALEEAAGRRIGDRLGFCYNPFSSRKAM